MRHLRKIILFLLLQNLPNLWGSGDIQSCEKNQFSCLSGRCIPRLWVCDGDKDCEDGSDEVHCSERWCSGFVCSDGGCIAASALCDGRTDCRDGSDELDGACGAIECKQDEFACRSRRRCVSLSFRCDGADDCGDGSDEDDCKNCASGSFRCVQSGSCVPAASVCDSIPHCPDGTDELDEVCGLPPAADPAPSCSNAEFRCGSGQCVPHSWRCDRSEDCADGSDERECDQNECLENNGGCSHLCVDQPLGFVCGCPSGMRLVHDTECEEIDRCLEADVCSQLCVHGNGTFTCSCHAGYLESPGTGECRATGEAALVVFIGSGGVRRIDTSGSEYWEVSGGVGAPGPLAVHAANRTVYLANSQRGAIYRMSLDGHSQEPVLVLKGLGAPMGLAVDWIHDLLYWTDARTRAVSVAPLNGAKRRVLINRLSKPTGVAVEPLLGFLFWADSGSPSRIERASMDGQDRMALVTSAIHSPVAISLDMPRGLLYWVDSALRTISRIAFDGQHRKTVVESNGHLDRPFGLAVFEGRVFWSDDDTRSLCTADKHNGSLFRVLMSGIGAAGGLALAHPALQPDGYGVCGRSGRLCQGRCVPRLFSSTEAPRFSCEFPAEAASVDLNSSGPEQAPVPPDTTFALVLSLLVVLSVLVTGLLLWWWRRECQSSRVLVLHGDISLKESQDPLVPVCRLEISPLKDALIKVDVDSD